MTYVLVRLSVVRPDAFAPILVTLLILPGLDLALCLAVVRPDAFAPIRVTLVTLPGLVSAFEQNREHKTTRDQALSSSWTCNSI